MRGFGQENGPVVKVAEAIVLQLSVFVQDKELETDHGGFPARERFVKIDTAYVAATALGIALDEFVARTESRQDGHLGQFLSVWGIVTLDPIVEQQPQID